MTTTREVAAIRDGRRTRKLNKPSSKPRRWPKGGDGAWCSTCGQRMVHDLAHEGFTTHPTCDPEFIELLDRARARQEAIEAD